jgi:hypothetical protein
VYTKCRPTRLVEHAFSQSTARSASEGEALVNMLLKKRILSTRLSVSIQVTVVLAIRTQELPHLALLRLEEPLGSELAVDYA